MTNNTFPSKATSWKEIFSFLNKINKKEPKRAGTLFEVFTKHYFLTVPSVASDYKQIWESGSIPRSIRERLNIPKKDFGADIVVETQDGLYGVVQCKFTSDQGSKVLGWTKDRMSSFIGQSSKANILIVFTNASAVDHETRRKAQEKKYFEFTLSHLSQLSNEEIQAILTSIKGNAPKKIKKLTPRPHQREAISAVLNGFKDNPKGKLILPCGAGKTLTALWIKEALRPKKTLVLVPSLALLRQFKDDWKAQEKIAGRYICVCSERDIDGGADSVTTGLEELTAPVTTESREIAKLLKIKQAITVYSTYQSSSAVAAALRLAKTKFDLVVCDEAHRTAGSAFKTTYSLVLNDKKLPSSRKLFMTATPKVVGSVVKEKGEEVTKYLADMNDINKYGPEFFRMSFGEAIKRGILVDYKLHGIGVTSKEVHEAIRARKFTSSTTIDELANNIALAKFMNAESAHHAVTFHSSVSRAKAFAERHRERVKNVVVSHVNGSQPTSERVEILNEQFKAAKRAVITNARCLTEGIDVPDIDCVYFCDPKGSKIDIVQASGRALRISKTNKKKIGHIVVPIFHKRGDNLENAIKHGTYNTLVSVVRAMASHDERIEEEIREISYGAGVRKASKQRLIVRGLNREKIIALTSIEKKLKEEIFSEVIRKSLVPWRSFEQARGIVRQLKIKSYQAWIAHVKKEVKKNGYMPNGIPSHPDRVYVHEGWLGWTDWLGTKNKSRAWKPRPFTEARNWARSLKLKNGRDWVRFVASKKLPDDIPASPENSYKNDGWIGIDDWLGTGRVTPANQGYRPFKSALPFARGLGLLSQAEWKRYSTSKSKPIDIPKDPEKVYKNSGWRSWDHWLGINKRSAHRIAKATSVKWRVFSQARSFAKNLELKSISEWWMYVRGELKKKKGIIPRDIPSRPDSAYRKSGWKNWGDWLGTGRSQNASYRSFSKARIFVRSLKLSSASQWNLYLKNKIPGKKSFPNDIPKSPHVYYKNLGWISWGDWLGTGSVSVWDKKYLSYSAARTYARTLKLATNLRWREFAKQRKNGKLILPPNIPADPYQYYTRQKEWVSWEDWLGSENLVRINPKHELAWLKQYKNLKAFYKTKKRWPRFIDKFQGRAIGNWCNDQRQFYKTNRLAPNRLKMLNKIGFDWNPLNKDQGVGHD